MSAALRPLLERVLFSEQWWCLRHIQSVKTMIEWFEHALCCLEQVITDIFLPWYTATEAAREAENAPEMMTNTCRQPGLL